MEKRVKVLVLHGARQVVRCMGGAVLWISSISPFGQSGHSSGTRPVRVTSRRSLGDSEMDLSVLTSESDWDDWEDEDDEQHATVFEEFRPVSPPRSISPPSRAGVEALGFSGLEGLVGDEFSSLPKEHSPKLVRVVVVGGGFAGLKAKHEIESFGIPGCFVTLVDCKRFFEYTPGMPRVLVQGDWQDVTRTYSPKGFIQGRARRVERESIVVESNGGGELRIPYDYAVLAMGGSYGSGDAELLKASDSVSRDRLQAGPVVTRARFVATSLFTDRLDESHSVLIVGAGYTGCELAAEIVEKYGRSMQVCLLDRNSEVCRSMPERSRNHVCSWLKRKGVSLILNAHIEVLTSTTCTYRLESSASDMRSISFDICLNCTGLRSNSSPLLPIFASSVDSNGRIVVNDELNVFSREKDGKIGRLFAIGDVAFHDRTKKYRGSAFYAELQAKVVAQNIRGSILGNLKRETFPEFVTGAQNSSALPQIEIVSLGDCDASLRIENLVINGFLGALGKMLIEETKMLEVSNNPLGSLTWKVADNLVLSGWRVAKSVFG